MESAMEGNQGRERAAAFTELAVSAASNTRFLQAVDAEIRAVPRSPVLSQPMEDNQHQQHRPPTHAAATAQTVEFWSSVQYGTFLKGLVRELPAHGWSAQQRFVVPEAAYRDSSGGLARLWMRFRSYGVYPARLFGRVLTGPKPSVMVVCTNTFYAPTLAVAAARRRGIPVIHWVFDLYPDFLINAGKVREGGKRAKCLAALTKYALTHADANVFLGEHMRDYTWERFGECQRSVVIAVGADGNYFKHEEPSRWQPEGRRRLNILYCGNMGRMHDFRTVAGLLQSGVPEGVRFRFHGGGVGMEVLQAALHGRLRPEEVTFGKSLRNRCWVGVMQKAQVALVTMRRQTRGLGIPSKTYSAMVAGQAILAVCERGNDLSDLIERHDCGWIIEPGDVDGLRATVNRIKANPDELHAKRLNAYRAGHEHYDQTVLAGDWAGLLDLVIRTRKTQ